MVPHDSHIIERRHTPRIHFRGKLLLATIPNFGSISFGVVENLSEIGLKVNLYKHLKGPFEKSDTVNFEMLEDYFRLQGEGEIAWISPDGDMAGIKFFQLTGENRRSLEDFLKLIG